MKILFIPLGGGIAHTGRLITISRELEKRGHEIVFGANEEISDLLDREKIRHAYLPELPKNRMEELKKLKTNFYSTKEITSLVESEIKLYKQEKINAVVSDTRPTVYISTRATKIPHIAVNNANVTNFYNYKKTGFPLPVNNFSEFMHPWIFNLLVRTKLQKKLLNKLGPKIVEALLIKQLLKFNIVLRKFGQKSTFRPFNLLTGDLTLICDAPFYRPVRKIPESVKVVGPAFWQPNMKTSPRVRKFIENSKKGKTVYVTAGGTGDPKVFKRLVSILSKTEYSIIATIGNSLKPDSINSKSKRVLITDFLPGDWVMRHSDALIFFGGNLTCYQALANGLPQIILPLHIDQIDNANQLERLGTGITINPYEFLEKDLYGAIDKILNDKKFKKAASRYKKEMAKWKAPVRAADEIESFLATQG